MEDDGEEIGNFTSVNYRIQLKRRSEFFVANMILPSVLINYLSLATFCMPADEKIGFSATIFLAQTVNLMSTSQFIPNGGVEIPIWGKYLAGSIIYMSAIILVNVILLNVKSSRKAREDCYKTTCKSICSKFVQKVRKRDKIEPENGNLESKDQVKYNQANHTDLGTNIQDKIDKMLFIIGFLFLTYATVATLIQLQN